VRCCKATPITAQDAPVAAVVIYPGISADLGGKYIVVQSN
jgi:hypothetical protein